MKAAVYHEYGPPEVIQAQNEVTGPNPCTGADHTLKFDIAMPPEVGAWASNRAVTAPISWVKVAGLAGIVVAAALGIAALFGLF